MASGERTANCGSTPTDRESLYYSSPECLRLAQIFLALFGCGYAALCTPRHPSSNTEAPERLSDLCVEAFPSEKDTERLRTRRSSRRSGYEAFCTFPDRMHPVQTRRVLWTPFTSARTRRRFGFQRRLVTLWAWLIRLPKWGLFPQMSQCIAIDTPRVLLGSTYNYIRSRDICPLFVRTFPPKPR